MNHSEPIQLIFNQLFKILLGGVQKTRKKITLQKSCSIQLQSSLAAKYLSVSLAGDSKAISIKLERVLSFKL